MSMGLLFWILMLLSVLFGWWSWQRLAPYGPFGVNLLLLVLLAILGWHAFGPPIHG